MTARVILITVIGLLVGAAAALSLISRPILPAGPLGGTVEQDAAAGEALIGGPFSLINTAGEPVTDKTYLGQPMLVYFGFTHCPDICPSGLQVISAALDQLGDRAQKVAPLFFTLDPERDTAPKLAEYLKSFHPRLIGLTGSPEAAAEAAKAYRVYATKVPSENSPGDYTVDHSGFMYVMDARGKFVTHFAHNASADKIAAALAKALADIKS